MAHCLLKQAVDHQCNLIASVMSLSQVLGICLLYCFCNVVMAGARYVSLIPMCGGSLCWTKFGCTFSLILINFFVTDKKKNSRSHYLHLEKSF